MIVWAMTNYIELVDKPTEKMEITVGWIMEHKDAYEHME